MSAELSLQTGHDLPLLEFALRYARAGFKVMPVKPRDKVPLTKHGAHDATSDPEQVLKWWAQWPNANIGITLGGLVVVDIDPRNGGDASNLPHELPITCFARSGGGGSHHLYRSPDGVRYDAHPATGIDVKAGPGVYIVVEPSIHPSGQKYCWLDETEPWAMQPAPAPEWLKKREQQATSAPASHGSIAEGGRNDSLARMAGSMRRRGMTQEAIEAALLVENTIRCSPPLQREEVQRIASSVSRYPAEPENHEMQRSTSRPTCRHGPSQGAR
jgi:hypothetical protein